MYLWTSRTATFMEQLFSEKKVEGFWNRKLKVLDQIKPCFSLSLKINFRKMACNKHVDLRKIKNLGKSIFKHETIIQTGITSSKSFEVERKLL